MDLLTGWHCSPEVSKVPMTQLDQPHLFRFNNRGWILGGRTHLDLSVDGDGGTNIAVKERAKNVWPFLNNPLPPSLR